MDKLISLNAAIKLIDELGYTNCRDSRDYEANNRMDKVRLKIQELPAAYNKEKMIEELEKCRQIMLSPASEDCFGEECRENNCMACVFNKAIEIAEKGGV